MTAKEHNTLLMLASVTPFSFMDIRGVYYLVKNTWHEQRMQIMKVIIEDAEKMNISLYESYKLTASIQALIWP